MDIEINKELVVLGRRMELLQLATSPYVEDVLDNGTETETEALQQALIDEFSDVVDRNAFFDALNRAYVEEGEPVLINS